MCCFNHMEVVKVHRRVKESDPIYAFKTLSIDFFDGVMRSRSHGDAWYGGKLQANRKPSKRGEGPGIYAYADRGTLGMALRGWVIVKVGLWGKVVEFRDPVQADGFMAHNATISEVWVADSYRDDLADYTTVKEILPETVVVNRPKIKPEPFRLIAFEEPKTVRISRVARFQSSRRSLSLH